MTTSSEAPVHVIYMKQGLVPLKVRAFTKRNRTNLFMICRLNMHPQWIDGLAGCSPKVSDRDALMSAFHPKLPFA